MKIFKKNFGFTMIELIMVVGLLGAVTIGTGLYLSDSFKDSNELSNKAQVQASVGALMNKLETTIKMADVPVFENLEEDNFTINYLNDDGTIKKVKFEYNKDNKEEIVYEDSIETNIYSLIESINVVKINNNGATITIVGEGNKYSLTSTFYSRNTITTASITSNKIYKVECYKYEGNKCYSQTFYNDVIDLTELPEPDLPGNIFLGWTLGKDGTEFIKDADGSYEDKIQLYELPAINEFYAIWEYDWEYENNGKAKLNYNKNTEDSVENMPKPSFEEAYLFGTKTNHEFTIYKEELKRRGYVFLGWDENKDTKVPTYKKGQDNTITFGNGEKTLYAIWRRPTPVDLIVGEYVLYVPSSSSYTVSPKVSGYAEEQVFNPSETQLWRVFSNDGETVEIISADSVDTLLYLRGKSGYINLVQTLEDIASAYINPLYATGARSFGYSESGLSVDDIANYRVIDIEEYPIENLENGFPYNSNQHESDVKIINDNSMYHSDEYVWIASRYADRAVYKFELCSVNLLYTRPFYHNHFMYYRDGNGDYVNNAVDSKIRPIVTLNSELEFIGGYGSEDEPYIVAEPTKNKYTITYSANEGYGTMEPQLVEKNSSIKLSVNKYQRHGDYKFLGWSTNSNAEVATYQPGQTITPTKDMTLYAVWKELPKYTLTYVANAPTGATVTKPENQIGSTVTVSTQKATRTKGVESAEFIGWSEQKGTWNSIQNNWIYGNDRLTLTADKTLYAVWNIIVTYDANEGKYSDGDTKKSFAKYTTEIAPYRELKSVDLPSRDNYILKGWARDKNTIDPEYGYGQWFYPSFDTTFYAVWESKDAIYDDTILAVGDALNKANIGVFVKYVPTSTKFEMSTDEAGSYGNHNPSNTQLWRVFKVNNDRTVELISADSATDVIIRGKMGYKNLAKLLSGLADAYVNTAYAISARPTGYAYKLTGDNLDAYLNMDESKYPIEYNSSTSWRFPYFDSYSHPDQTVFENNPVLKVFDRIIMPTREAVTTAPTDKELGYTTFFHRILYSSNNMYGARLYQEYSDGTYSYGSQTCGFRPIVTLIANLPITGGSGSYNDPYILGTCQHNWVLTDTTQNDCTVITVYTCGICGETRTQTTTEHKWTKKPWAPKDETHCYKLCDCTQKEMTEKHDWDNGVVVGDKLIYTCNRCGGSKSGDALATVTIKHYVNDTENVPYTLYKTETKDVLIGSTLVLEDYVSNEGNLKDASYLSGSKLCSAHNVVDGKCSKCELTSSAGIFNVGVKDANGNICGDANGDGMVTYEDAFLVVQKNDLNLDVTIEEGNSDINGDGMVNTKDGKLIYQYLNGVDATSVEVFADGSLIINLYYKKVYTLTYDANGGNGAPASQTGTTITISSTIPTKSGWTFAGWSTSATGRPEYPAGGSITLTADTTLYAVWTKIHTLIYNANGGSGAPETETKTVTSESYIFTISSTEPARDGYKFLGWSESSTGTSASYQAGATITVTGDKTLYAVWEKVVVEYTLTYNANGGNGAPASQTGTTITISSTIPTKSGMLFAGWATSSSATSPDYPPGRSITLTEDTTLYAVWNEVYTLTYDANGGSGAPAAQTGTRFTTFTINSTEPIRDGYKFLGWATSSSATSAEYQEGNKIKLTEDTTLYAVWENVEPARQITLTYTTSDGASLTETVPEPQVGQVSDSKPSYTFIVTDEEATRTDGSKSAVFVGWSKTTGNWDNEPANLIKGGANLTITQDTTLHAVWAIKVIYNGNNGKYSDQAIEKYFTKYTTAVAPYRELKSSDLPEREGYVLKGWSTEENTINPQYGYGEWFYPWCETKFYAVWESKTQTYGNIDGQNITNATLGAYVKYEPTQTSINIDSSVGWNGNGIINPSQTTLWRVFRKVDGTVELVSAHKATDLILKGEKSYKNLVSILCTLADAYKNDYATKARPFGYNYSLTDQTKLSQYKTITDSLVYGLKGFPYKDGYENSADRTVLANNPILKIWDRTIVASRNVVTSTADAITEYQYCRLHTSGSAFEVGLYKIKSGVAAGGGTTLSGSTSGFRPIVTLKSGIKVTGGDGSYNNPYTIGLGCTITYDANGGKAAPLSQSGLLGDKITLRDVTPIKAGYTFKGWSKNSLGEGKIYSAGEEVELDGDMYLYAIWQ